MGKELTVVQKIFLKIRHFMLDAFRNVKIWYYAIIGKVVPVPLRDDYDVTDNVRWLIEFSAPAAIIARRKQLLQTAKIICIYFILPVLAGITVAFIVQNTTTR